MNRISGMFKEPVEIKVKVAVRWLIRRDHPSVLAIENQSFQYPHTKETLLDTLRQKNVIGFVATLEERVVGHMLYSLQKGHFYIKTIAVDPAYLRLGVASQLVKKLTDKLEESERTRVVTDVRESNLTAQVFFRRIGFRAISVLKEPYDNSTEDAYHMEYTQPDYGNY